MPDSNAYALIGAALAHLIDSMNKANSWKDHSSELVEIAGAFREIAGPLSPEGVENALQAHIESENEDERATYAKTGTTLTQPRGPACRFRKSCRIRIYF